MKKILSLFFVLTLSLISLVTLTACDKTKAEDLLRTFLIEEDGKNVKENFSVPAELTSGEETYELTWSSNNQNLTIGEKVDKNYVVNVARPAQDEAATLTVTLKLSKKNTATKDFTIYLSPIDVYDFVDEFSQPGVFKENGTSVTTDFALATEYALTNHPTEKATITWVSNNTDALAISEDGKTALVYPSSEEVSVRLTATFTYKGETSQAKFTVKVSSPKTPYENLMYWYNNTGITQTISGYVVCVAAEYSESYGNISLYVIDDTLKGGYYLYRTKASADEAAKLLDENGNFKLGVHVTVTGASNTSYNGLMETNAGGNLVVDTDVTPINVEETYYAIDNDLLANAQSLYYRMSTLVTLTNWKVKELGDPIEAGANSTVLVLEKNGYEIKIRYSKYIQNALGEDNAAAFQAGLAGIAVGDYVNVKGLLSYYNSDKEAYDADSYQIFMTAPDSVTKGTQDDAELLGVKVGAALEAFDALAELYVAPTTVTLPTELNGVTIAWSIPESNVAKSVALEENKLTLTPQTKLETVNVIGTYTNGAYSTVVYYSFKTQSLSDAEMIDKALEELVIEDQYAPKDVTLPASNELYGVTFSYALKGTPTSVTLAEGVLTVDNSTLTEDEKVTLVVTATKGESSKEVEIEITVHKLEVITIAKFLENKDKDTVSLLEGVITAVNKVGESGSFVLTDAAGTSIFCYSGLNVTLGDEIQVLGVYAENYSFPQIGNPVLVKTISTGNDVEAKSGTKVEYTTAEISTKINDSTLTDATCAAAFSGQYLQIRGYVYEASSATLVKMSTDSSSETEVVRIYANSGLALNEYLNKEITILCFARGTNLTSKYITVQAQAVVLSDAEKVSIAKEALSLDVTETLVDFTLPVTGEQGTTITWESNNAAIAVSGANATVTRPAVGAEDATVKLTATITSGSATDTKEFTVTVKAQSADPNVDKVAADKAELTIITTAYKNLTLPTEGTEGSAITWASSNEEVIATNGTITPSADATVVTLTATLTLGDVTETKIFEVTVLPQATVAEFLTAKNTEKAVVLTGIITAVNRPSEGLSSFVLTDAAGTSIFCYSGLAVALGDEVILSGKYTENYSFPQIGTPSLLETVSTGNEVATKSGTAVELTASEIADAFVNTTFTDATLAAEYSGKYLVITGYVYSASEKYVKMSTDSSSETEVVRIYFDTDLALDTLVGKEVVVYSFARGTNLSYKYITVQAQSAREAVYTDAEKVALDKAALTLPEETTENLTLPTTGAKGSTITWASSNTAVIANDGTVTRPAAGSEDATVTLTATITSGESTETATFEVLVAAIPTNPNIEIVATDKAALELVESTSTNLTLPATGTAGSTITWVSSNTAVIANDGTVVRPAYADGNATVTLTATLTSGEGDDLITDTKEFSVVVLKQNPATAYETKTYAEADSLGQTAGSSYTSEKYYLKGVIKNVNSTTYGNMYIQDEEGNEFYIYGTYSFDGETRYDAMTTKPVAGDFVVVYGALGTYNNNSQMKNGWLVQFNDVDYAAQNAVTSDLAALELPTETTENLTLPTTGTAGSTITWASSNEAVIANDGTVTRPEEGSEDATVTLTATVKYNNTEETKEFSVVVKAKVADPNVIAVETDKAALELPAATTENLTLPTAGTAGSTITWASTNEAVIAVDGTVTRPAYADGDATVTLTATLTSGEYSDTATFEVAVAKQLPAVEYATKTFEEATTLAGTTKNQYTSESYYLKGYIKNVQNTTYGNMYVQDEEGNEFYIYGTYSFDGTTGYSSMSNKPVAGDYVVVYGVLGFYSSPQMKNGWIVQIGETDYYAENAVEADKTALELPTETKENLTLPTTGAKGSTITWVSSAPTVIANDGTVVRPAVGSEDAEVTLVATITYNNEETTKEFALVVPALSANPNVDIVAADKAALELPEETTENLTLETTGANGSTITWTSTNEAVIALDGTVVRPALGEADVEVTLTATLTSGEGEDLVTDTKEFKVTVKAEQPATTTVTLAYTGTSTTNMDGSNQASTLGLDATLFSVVGAKVSASNNVGLNKAGNMRFYNGGNTLTVTGTGITITSIKINYLTSGDYAGSDSKFTITAGEAAATLSNGVATINASSFVLTNSSKAGFTSIEISYFVNAQ